jgi:hypothetical protein
MPADSCSGWTGSWELEGRSEWTPWLKFLGVPEAMWAAATKAPDFHRYIVNENEFTMDHRIPGQKMHLYFTAKLNGQWAPCPYPQPTATLWKDGESKAPTGGKPGQWRHQWVAGKRGTAFETEIVDFAGKGKTVKFVRELTGVYVHTAEMKFTVYVLDDNGKDAVVGPCFTTFKRTGDLVPEAPETPPVTLVIGATGGCGRHAYKACVGLGMTVKAMARDAAKAKSILGSEAQVVVGDVRSSATLDGAMSGVTTLIVAIGKARGDEGSSSQAVDYEGVCNIVAAAKRQNIKKIVHVTSNGIDSPQRTFICFLNYMTNMGLGWKLRGEKALHDSGIPYVVVRPVGLSDKQDDVAPLMKQCEPYEWGMCMISREAVGHICANAIKHAPDCVTLNCRNDPAKPSGGLTKFDWKAAFSTLRKDVCPLPCGFDDHEKATNAFARNLKALKWFSCSMLGMIVLWLIRTVARRRAMLK